VPNKSQDKGEKERNRVKADFKVPSKKGGGGGILPREGTSEKRMIKRTDHIAETRWFLNYVLELSPRRALNYDSGKLCSRAGESEARRGKI